MTSVSFCDYNNAFLGTNWEKKINSYIMSDMSTNEPLFKEKTQLQSMHNKNGTIPGHEKIIDNKGQDYNTNIINDYNNISDVSNLKTFSNAFACNLRNNEFQNDIAKNQLQLKVNPLNSGSDNINNEYSIGHVYNGYNREPQYYPIYQNAKYHVRNNPNYILGNNTLSEYFEGFPTTSIPFSLPLSKILDIVIFMLIALLIVNIYSLFN